MPTPLVIRPGLRAVVIHSLCVAALVLFSAGALAQTEFATVYGTIIDPSGAVAPGAQITIVRQRIGLRRSAHSPFARYPVDGSSSLVSYAGTAAVGAASPGCRT